MADNIKKYIVVEFKEGLQIISKNWLMNDFKIAKWPKGFMTNKKYDKVVKHGKT